MNADAWLVIAPDGLRAVFLDHAVAMNYAARCYGVVKPLKVVECESAEATEEPAP